MEMKEQQYETLKCGVVKGLLADKSVCEENRELFKDFFKWEEVKLRRQRSIMKLDEHCWRTIKSYVSKFRNIDKWFGKPLKDITKEDIQRVYDDLEDGRILSAKGKPYTDRKSFYNKVFKSRLFHMIRKKDIAKDIIITPAKEDRVRYITEEDFKKIVSVVVNVKHKLLCWLAWDIGENINSLLQLRKCDCIAQKNPHTNSKEYKINLRKEILKRSRTARGEITNHAETIELLDIVFSQKIQEKKKVKNEEGKEEEQIVEREWQDKDLLFPFAYSNAKKFLYRALRITGVKTFEPRGLSPTWKDLRSSMACYLLKNDWSYEEVNARLGHKPSSSELDKYVSHLALDKHKPKAKLHDNALLAVRKELAEVKAREKLYADRLEKLSSAVLSKIDGFTTKAKPEEVAKELLAGLEYENEFETESI